MKKFKLVSTIVSIVLMLGLLAFGVYAASNTATFSVNSTVSFTVQNVFVKVKAGLGNSVPDGAQEYYSSPTGEQKDISQLTTFGNANFVDEDSSGNVTDTISFYFYIENMHNMPIYLMLGYKWMGSSKYNASNKDADGAVSVRTNDDAPDGVTFGSQNKSATVDGGVRSDTITSSTDCLVFGAKTSKTVVFTINMKQDAMIYKLTSGSFSLNVSASLDVISSVE